MPFDNDGSRMVVASFHLDRQQVECRIVFSITGPSVLGFISSPKKSSPSPSSMLTMLPDPPPKLNVSAEFAD